MENAFLYLFSFYIEQGIGLSLPFCLNQTLIAVDNATSLNEMCMCHFVIWDWVKVISPSSIKVICWHKKKSFLDWRSFKGKNNPTTGLQFFVCYLLIFFYVFFLFILFSWFLLRAWFCFYDFFCLYFMSFLIIVIGVIYLLNFLFLLTNFNVPLDTYLSNLTKLIIL